MLRGPNSGTTVLPRNTKPAARILAIDLVVVVGYAVAPLGGAVRAHDARGVGEVLDRDRARRGSASDDTARAAAGRRLHPPRRGRGRSATVMYELRRRVQRLDACRGSTRPARPTSPRPVRACSACSSAEVKASSFGSTAAPLVGALTDGRKLVTVHVDSQGALHGTDDRPLRRRRPSGHDHPEPPRRPQRRDLRDGAGADPCFRRGRRRARPSAASCSPARARASARATTSTKAWGDPRMDETLAELAGPEPADHAARRGDARDATRRPWPR